MKCPSLRQQCLGSLAVPMDWPLPAPLASFLSLSDSYFVFHSCQIPNFFYASVPFLMLFLLARLPFSTFFSKTLPTYSLRLCMDAISSRKCSLLSPRPQYSRLPSIKTLASPWGERSCPCLPSLGSVESLCSRHCIRVTCHPVQCAHHGATEGDHQSRAIMGPLLGSSNKLT